MAFMIIFKSSIEQSIVIDKDVKSFIPSDDKLLIRYEDGTDDMYLGVHSIAPFYYNEG